MYLRFAFRLVETALTEAVEKLVRASLFSSVSRPISGSVWPCLPSPGITLTANRAHRADLPTSYASFAPVLVAAQPQDNKQPWVHGCAREAWRDRAWETLAMES